MNANTISQSRVILCAVITLSMPLHGLLSQEQLHASLHPPRHVMVGDAPIDIERSGHSAPFFGDIDGDGLRDLLVGEFYEGRVRVYRNVGTATDPKFKDFEWVKTAVGLAKVPSD